MSPITELETRTKYQSYDGLSIILHEYVRLTAITVSRGEWAGSAFSFPIEPVSGLGQRAPLGSVICPLMYEVDWKCEVLLSASTVNNMYKARIL